MAEQLQHKILSHMKSERYRPQRARGLAKDLELHDEVSYPSFRQALRELMDAGRVVLGASGTIVLPGDNVQKDVFIGTYRQNKRGFGFVMPSDVGSREDLFIPEGENGGAITGDVVRARITSRGQKDGKAMYSGRIIEIMERSQKRFVGSLIKQHGEWCVLPDGNTFTQPILAPDAAARHIKPGTKVVIEMTSYPEGDQRGQGVITEVLGKAGEKDVDLQSVIVQYNLPGPFPDDVLAQAREAVDSFDPLEERSRRLDLTGEVVCTIDPPDAKDYDDAISLRHLGEGEWELGVHIADVSFFVPDGSPLDVEARQRGNSSYFPGHVIPMLPEILSNGVCSLQEGVPRLCKSAFITYDKSGRPVGSRFANTIINSRKRLRYIEAQAIIDGADVIPHPDGDRTRADYASEVVELLGEMDTLAKILQKRRREQGQLVLDLPEAALVLDEDGKVIDAVEEDESFTHTLIEMFMVEANEAVARLLDGQEVPFLRRTHADPNVESSERLSKFIQVSGFKLPKDLDRKALQTLLAAVKGKPEGFTINLAVLKSLSRAEYSPEVIGHYALASQHYAHFTSPIRRYADLTIHRLLDAYIDARERVPKGKRGKTKAKIDPETVPSHNDLVEMGRHISFTERRSDDAERELRQVKLLELMSTKIGEEFTGVVTGVTNFGLYIQIQKYLVDGLIRYESLMDDWWHVDDRGGFVRGERSGTKIGVGDVVKVYIVRVDVPRRELDLAISEFLEKSRKGPGANTEGTGDIAKPGKGKKPGGGGSGRAGGGRAGGGGNRSKGKGPPRSGGGPRGSHQQPGGKAPRRGGGRRR